MTGAGGTVWSRAPLGRGVTVLAVHPAGLAALDKPAGVLSHPNRPGEEGRCLLAAPYDAAGECFAWSDGAGGTRRAWLLHRLDGATSGVILLANDEGVAAAARTAFEHRRVRKHYLAVVLGHPREKRTVWRDAMGVRRAGGAVRAEAGGTMMAETAMRCLRLVPGPPGLAVLELEPRTGRTHQLRHQCARRRLPILGDQTYGQFRVNRELARRLGTARLFLHARSVSLEFEAPGEKVVFAAASPPPEAFAPFLERR